MQSAVRAHRECLSESVDSEQTHNDSPARRRMGIRNHFQVPASSPTLSVSRLERRSRGGGAAELAGIGPAPSMWILTVERHAVIFSAWPTTPTISSSSATLRTSRPAPCVITSSRGCFPRPTHEGAVRDTIARISSGSSFIKRLQGKHSPARRDTESAGGAERFTRRSARSWPSRSRKRNPDRH